MIPKRIEMPVQVEEILGKLREHGYEAFAVGGCVRDAILGRIPGDWDITTSAKPEDVKGCSAERWTLGCSTVLSQFCQEMKVTR